MSKRAAERQIHQPHGHGRTLGLPSRCGSWRAQPPGNSSHSPFGISYSSSLGTRRRRWNTCMALKMISLIAVRVGKTAGDGMQVQNECSKTPARKISWTARFSCFSFHRNRRTFCPCIQGGNSKRSSHMKSCSCMCPSRHKLVPHLTLV